MATDQNTGAAECEVYFYGTTGQELETDGCWSRTQTFAGTGINTYFAGKMLSEKNAYVLTDRLGSVRGDRNGVSLSYFPWGEERGAGTADLRTKFAGYFRDGVGQDYAMARYYSATSGGFWSPDPGGMKTANSGNPTTWNRYEYVAGDPINAIDPRGTDLEYIAGAIDCTDNFSEEACGDPCNNPDYIAGYVPSPGCGGTSVENDSVDGPGPDTSTDPLCPLVSLTGNFTVASGVIALFAPDIAAKIDAAFAILNQEGVVPMITSRFRNASRQAQQQGSPYGAAQVSWHQVGEAIDLNSKVSTSTEQEIVAAMTAEGLTWGGTFKHNDPVHFQNAPAGTSPSAAQVAACAKEHQ